MRTPHSPRRHALRAIALGYTKVLWYRGGIEAWSREVDPEVPRY